MVLINMQHPAKTRARIKHRLVHTRTRTHTHTHTYTHSVHQASPGTQPDSDTRTHTHTQRASSQTWFTDRQTDGRTNRQRASSITCPSAQYRQRTTCMVIQLDGAEHVPAGPLGVPGASPATPGHSLREKGAEEGRGGHGVSVRIRRLSRFTHEHNSTHGRTHNIPPHS